jgi:hypothetical protein
MIPCQGARIPPFHAKSPRACPPPGLPSVHACVDTVCLEFYSSEEIASPLGLSLATSIDVPHCRQVSLSRGTFFFVCSWF